jgi:hypothetical protein
MENATKSHNSSINTSSKELIFPSGTQILLYMVLAPVLILILNVKRGWDYLNDSVIAPQGGAEKLLTQNRPGLQKALDSIAGSIILQVAFWVVVGCLVYIVIWFVRNIAVNLLNDFVADNYVHPKSYRRLEYWESILARKVFFWISAICSILLTLTGMRLLFYMAKLAYSNTVHFGFPHSLIALIEIELATTGLIYALMLLFRVMLNSWRLISRDL